MWKFLLPLWLYRNSLAGYNLSFFESRSRCVFDLFVGGGKLYVLLLNHLVPPSAILFLLAKAECPICQQVTEKPSPKFLMQLLQGRTITLEFSIME